LPGCKSVSPRDFALGATDGSTTPITENQAWAIAKAEVTKREHWPDHQVGQDKLIHTVCYIATRIDNGRWRVVAYKCVTEDHPDAGCAYDAIRPAIMIINRKGIVTRYFRGDPPD
jgi:hypothetical protein